MAAQALGPGATIVRRRAFFGLLDAGGWAWATVKAAFWFVVIIMLMAYLPDRALYATVQPTIEIGVPLQTFNKNLNVTPVNLCPPSDRDAAVPRAGRAPSCPWQPNPPELGLPEARTDAAIVAAGLETLLVGGSDGKAAQDSVFATVDPAGRQHRRLDQRRPPAGAAGRCGRGLLRRRRLRDRRHRRGRRADRHRLRRHARRRQREDHVLERVGRPEAAGASRGRGGRRLGRRDPPHRWPGCRRPGRHGLAGAAQGRRPARSSHGASWPPCRRRGRGRPRSSSGRTSSSTAARTPPGPRPTSCAARSASSRATRSRP